MKDKTCEEGGDGYLDKIFTVKGKPIKEWGPGAYKPEAEFRD